MRSFKSLIAFLLVISLASTALAGGGTRTFYLVDASQGESDETPGDRGSGHTDGTRIESVDGTRFVAVLPYLSAPLSTSAFHLHLADRRAFVEADYTTRVEVSVQDESGRNVVASGGMPWLLGTTTVTASSNATEGWRDIRFVANQTLSPDAAQRGFVIADGSVIVPAGLRLVLMFGLVSGEPKIAPGQAFASATHEVATGIHESGLIPGMGDIPGPVLNRVDLDENVTVAIRSIGGSNGRNVDALAGGFAGTPASTFRADDAGSWLAISG